MASTTDKTVTSKYQPKSTNVIWVDTSLNPPVEKHFINGKWRPIGGGGSQGTTNYPDLENKPQINGVELSGNKTSNDLGVYSKPSGGIPESDLSSDVQQALQKHFKGWYDDDTNLPSNPVVGDYAYVKGATSTDPAAIYECTTDGTWSDSGRTADTSNVQTFASGEEVNETYIDDTHLVNSKDGALPTAEDAQLLSQKLRNINLTETKIDVTQDIIVDGYINSSGVPTSYLTTKSLIINVEGYDYVRFLGLVRKSSFSSPNYCCFYSDANGMSVLGSAISLGFNSVDEELLKEFILPIPQGAKTFRCNYVSSSTAPLDSNFYCYLQIGNAPKIINDLTTGGVDDVLSAEQGKYLYEEIGKTIIEENPNNAGKYINLNVEIGSTITLQYPSTDSAYHFLVQDCVAGDKIIVNSKIGNNKTAWGFIDSSNKLIEKGQNYNISTPIDLSVELVVPNSAVKCIINSRNTDKKSYYSSKDSIYNEFDIRLDGIDEKLEVNNLVNYPIDAITIRNTAVYKTSGVIYSSDSWCSVILPITAGMTKLKFTTDVQSNNEYGFFLNDGTWQGTANTNGVKSVDVPDGAKEFRMCYKYASHPNNKILVTGNKAMLTEIKQNFLFALNRNINNIYNVVEANNTGRFDYMSVSVYDYINAFNELSYTFPDFVKMTNIGTSQEPSDDASDMNTYPIVRYRYKKSTVNPTKVISLMSGIHGDSENPGIAGWKNNGGDSPQNILSLYFFLLDLMMNPEKDGYYKALTDNYIIDVVPIINPWGVQNHSRTNGRNVDLNRNFDYRWSESASEVKGSSAFSESESQAYRDYINSLIEDTTNSLQFVVEVHSRGNLTTSNQGRFWGVGPSDYTLPKLAQTKVAGKYGTGTPNWTTYDSTNAEPMGWAWTYFVKGIPSFNPECCQSLNGDLSTRNSKLVNVQMVDFISEIILTCANVKILQL